MNKIKIPYIILSFVFSFLLLIICLYAYNQYIIAKPIHEALSGIEDIVDNETIITTRTKHVIITLDTQDFMTRYQEIMAIINEFRNPESYTIEIIDHRNPSIVTKYNYLSFDVFEAIETKKYSDLIAIMENVEDPYTLKIEMDEKFFYLNLRNGEHYLYKLIPRYLMIG